VRSRHIGVEESGVTQSNKSGEDSSVNIEPSTASTTSKYYSLKPFRSLSFVTHRLPTPPSTTTGLKHLCHQRVEIAVTRHQPSRGATTKPDCFRYLHSASSAPIRLLGIDASFSHKLTANHIARSRTDLKTDSTYWQTVCLCFARLRCIFVENGCGAAIIVSRSAHFLWHAACFSVYSL
jgi:hypothetical protein